MSVDVRDDVDELLCVVDLDDRLLAHRTRGDCHADAALVHRSVYVVVLTPDGLLLQRRGRHKRLAPRQWDLACAGHVGAGESYAEAARRELEEEVGLRDVEPRPLGRIVLSLPGETEMCTVHVVEHAGPFRVLPPEVIGLAAFAPDELPAPLCPGAVDVLAAFPELLRP